MKVFVLISVYRKSKINEVIEDISCVVSYKKMIRVGLAYDLILELEGSEIEIRQKNVSLRHLHNIGTVLQLNVVA